MTRRAKILACVTGITIGACAAGVVVVSGLIPATHAALGGARLTMLAQDTGELDVHPNGRFLRATDLEPGPKRSGAAGAVRITNRTAAVMALRVRAIGPPRELGDLGRVAVTARNATLFEGPLRGLHDWSPGSMRLDPGQTGRIVVRAWLPASVHDGYQARGADLTLGFATRPVVGR